MSWLHGLYDHMFFMDPDVRCPQSAIKQITHSPFAFGLWMVNLSYNKNWKSLAFDVIRTLGMSNQIIFYNLQIIWLLLSIDLDT